MTKIKLPVKLYVAGKSKEVQEKVFKMGGKWAGGTLEQEVSNIHVDFLFINEHKQLMGASSMSYFKDHDFPEITVDEFLAGEFEKEEHTFKPFDRVLVRDREDNLWINTHFGTFLNDEDSYPYVCGHMRYRYCIPYEGNEHLLGTTNEPE